MEHIILSKRSDLLKNYLADKDECIWKNINVERCSSEHVSISPIMKSRKHCSSDKIISATEQSSLGLAAGSKTKEICSKAKQVSTSFE